MIALGTTTSYLKLLKLASTANDVTGLGGTVAKSPAIGLGDKILGFDLSTGSVVRAFTRGAMGRRIDPSWGGPIELFLVPASAPRLV